MVSKVRGQHRQRHTRTSSIRSYNWTYDPTGDILSATADNGNTAVYTYSNTQPNELVASSAAMDPTTSFSYDSSGNTTGITTTDTTPVTSSLAISTNIGYDSQSRPSVLTHIDGTYSTNTAVVFDTITMSYNALGQRSAYTVTTPGEPGIMMHFQYDDGGQLYQNSVMSGTVQGSSIVTTTYTDTYVYRPDGLPLELVRQQSGTTNRYWYVLDGQGSVIALVDVNDKVVDSYAYDLWGEPLPGLTKQQVMQQFRYKSYWLDDATGWYWFDAQQTDGVHPRQYDPEAMRFMQPDGSADRSYVYAGDNPVATTTAAGSLGLNGIRNGIRPADACLEGGGGANPSSCGGGGDAGGGGDGDTNGDTTTNADDENLSFAEQIQKYAKDWYRGTFKGKTAQEQSLRYHWQAHGEGKSPAQYTKDALDYYRSQRANPRPWKIGNPDAKGRYIMGIKYGYPGGEGGIYYKGQVVSFWYHGDYSN